MRRPRNNEGIRAAFGLWADQPEDGLAYQERMREEWAERERDEERIRSFLSSFQLVPFSDSLAERVVLLRRERRIKLPDAIILASAMQRGWVLVTRNTRDFRQEREW